MARKIWKFFCSARLTVILFVLILIPSVIGTIIQQNAPDPGRYAEIYGPTWDGIFRYLGFYDIYHDLRFIILLVLLGLNTFACTLNRFRLRWRLAGMMMTHFGLLLILIGALMGAILGEKGFIVISEGKTTNQMSIDRVAQTMDTLPFEVKLVDFILDLHEEPAHRLVVLDVKANRQEGYKVQEGQTIRLPQPRWAKLISLAGITPGSAGTINLKQILPHAAAVTSVTEGPEETGTAAMEFRITRDGMEERGFALSRPAHPYVFNNARLGIGYMKLTGKNLIDEEIRKAISLSKDINQLEVTVPAKNIKRIYPAEVGSELDVEGTEYSVKVLRYVPDFVIDFGTREVTSRSDFPNNPAIQIRIMSPSGSSEQWVFSRFPSTHTAADASIELRFRRNQHFGNIVDYVLVLNAPDSRPALAHIREGKLMAKAVIDIGQPVSIEETAYGITVDRFFENANMLREIVNRSDRPNRPAMEISVEQGGSSNSYYLWEKTPTDVGNYRMMYTQEDRVRDFYSILQIIDDGKVAMEKKIEVNDPLRYEGYALYQSSYDDEGLSWSGLQVKKDPGIPLVYGGFSLQVLGMIIIFYINPLMRKARKS
ncbi:MAG: cytochrome c biogenesis protein ResB [Candidatus Hydrogenedentota bacterium]|nr:MAG: cytochrome c biogenesis protein ResB [Candidatus Hydrogenedentota bacterium]